MPWVDRTCSGAEAIARQFPSVALGDIDSVLAYYLQHRDEVDAYLRERREQAEELRRLDEERCVTSALRRRLRERLQSDFDDPTAGV